MADTRPTLQHLNDSQSQVILWLLEELGIEYKLNLFQRKTDGLEKNRAPEALKETHPLGKSPQLITPEGRVIAERAAIAKYLIDKYDTTGRFKLNPNDTENDAVREEELISFGGSSLSPILMIQLVLNLLAQQSPFFIRPITRGIGTMLNSAFLGKEVDTMMSYLDRAMTDRSYFLKTESPTRTDFMMLWYADFYIIAGNRDLSKYPNLKAFVERCKGRDAWKRSVEKGNGYELEVQM